MSQVLILLRKSLLTFWRNKAAVAITFLVPIVLIYLFGHVFGLYSKDTGPTGIPIAVVNLSPEPAAQKLIDALKAEKTFRVITTYDLGKGATRPLTEADVRAGLNDNWYRYALILPAESAPGRRLRRAHEIPVQSPQRDRVADGQRPAAEDRLLQRAAAPGPVAAKERPPLPRR